MASENDLAYAAGIIDGEGYIGITVGSGRRSPVFQCVVSVGMCDLEVVAWLHETFGGNLYSYPPGPKYGKRGRHQWTVTAGRAESFCRDVRPYLRLKHRQAELLVRYRQDTKLDHTRSGGRGVSVPPAEVEARREYVTELKALNGRMI